MAGPIRAGVGGWTFAPWRGVFYPRKTRHADELAYASGRLTAIEVNSTYYAMQNPATFAKWAAQTPDDFVFAIKASRFCTNRRVLADAKEPITRFLSQGIVELGPKLGPILWQFMQTKTYDAADFAAFLRLLPQTWGGVRLRHCVEVKNASFRVPEFVSLCRERGVAICCSHNDAYPLIGDATADFVYARLQMGADEIPTGYAPAELDRWARRLKAYARGAVPTGLALVDAAGAGDGLAREVFCFFISGGKVRAPAAAMGLIERVGRKAR
ncbi:MAG TPA: DUF72 domain-containing protein [Caulobacteraceae bacterium]